VVSAGGISFKFVVSSGSCFGLIGSMISIRQK
jgi:hypothetical protein